MLYVYIVCVHIQNHGVVECKYLPFSTKHWGLVCCEINQKFKKPTTQYCFSIIILCLWSHLWISIWTQRKLLGKPQLLRLPCERHAGVWQWGLLRTGAALWRRISFQVFPRLKNQSLRVTVVEVYQLSIAFVDAKMDHRWGCFKYCVGI